MVFFSVMKLRYRNSSSNFEVNCVFYIYYVFYVGFFYSVFVYNVRVVNSVLVGVRVEVIIDESWVCSISFSV